MRAESWNKVFVDTEALENNFRLLQKRAGDIPLLAMVKANAYGHGLKNAAMAFAKAGCCRFGVAELCEGVALRQFGMKGDIYITIGFGKGDASSFFEYDLIPVICTFAQAAMLEEEAVKRAVTIGVHLKINTGMGRLGLQPEEVKRFAEKLSQYPHLRINGAMSHFPEADVPGASSTTEAFEKFQSLRIWLKEHYGAICHIANSAALLNHPETYCDMIRAGIALYGYHPAGREGLAQSDIGNQLKPAMRFVTRILQIKEYPKGTAIGYGRTFITPKPMKIGIIPVGYEDGLCRSRSNGGHVLVGGKKVAICGRVCMNMSMLDVSELPEIQVEDEVVVMGSQQGETITADHIAAETNTISYEILCRFGHMNKHFVE